VKLTPTPCRRTPPCSLRARISTRRPLGHHLLTTRPARRRDRGPGARRSAWPAARESGSGDGRCAASSLASLPSPVLFSQHGEGLVGRQRATPDKDQLLLAVPDAAWPGRGLRRAQPRMRRLPPIATPSFLRLVGWPSLARRSPRHRLAEESPVALTRTPATHELAGKRPHQTPA